MHVNVSLPANRLNSRIDSIFQYSFEIQNDRFLSKKKWKKKRQIHIGTENAMHVVWDMQHGIILRMKCNEAFSTSKKPNGKSAEEDEDEHNSII